MELHAALHAAPARFTTWDSRHHHLSAHGSVGQHTDQLDSKEKKEGGGLVRLSAAFPVWFGTHAPLREPM